MGVACHGDGERSGGGTKRGCERKEVLWNKVEIQSRFVMKGYQKCAIWRTVGTIDGVMKGADGSGRGNQ